MVEIINKKIDIGEKSMKQYYLQNTQRDEHVPYVSWWKQGDRGYTDDITLAKVFTEDQIEGMASIKIGHKVPWLVEYIDSIRLVSGMIKVEHLDAKAAYEMQEKQSKPKVQSIRRKLHY